MEVTTIRSNGKDANFSLRGKCPHCGEGTVCTIVGHPYIEDIPSMSALESLLYKSPAERWCVITQCQGCTKYVLAIATREPHPTSPGQPTREPFKYEAHYPVGSPRDSVEESVPLEVREAFREALRSRFVNAYQATVLMCRRSLQISCDMELLGSNATEEQKKKHFSKDLYSLIEDLKSRGQITQTLRDMAQNIRILGNRGAHRDYTDINHTVKDRDADLAIEFMKQYFQFVYVLPAKSQTALLGQAKATTS